MTKMAIQILEFGLMYLQDVENEMQVNDLNLFHFTYLPTLGHCSRCLDNFVSIITPSPR